MKADVVEMSRWDKPMRYPDPFRLLVCGGRYYTNRNVVFAALDEIRQRFRGRGIVVIQGGARGADALAAAWARDRGVRCETYIADWDREGPAAGPRRNQRMLEGGRPELCLAFPGGSGTADMVTRCLAYRVRVFEVQE